MKLKCKIKNKEYPIVQGVTFSEEYNETLDSGTIIITHVSKARNLKPYNDVFIYDNEFNGFGGEENPKQNNKFYKHMLVQNFTEEIINLKDSIYSYTISLMSEIKALEKIQLPNISITQPLKKEKKVSIYEYLVRFVKMYSPKIKVATDKNNKKWKYQPKYRVDPKLKDIFGDTYSPDFSLNLPSLRDVLSQLMIVKDMIPYVEDNVIKAMDITLRKKDFNLDVGHMNYITGTMNESDYCTSVRRSYSDALSSDSTCQSIEYLGFRNSDIALMKIEDLRIETRFPIYKINKIYLAYYKKTKIKYDYDETSIVPGWGGKELGFLCKYDITPLVKLNTERNVLDNDWKALNDENPQTIEAMAKHKMCTIGYDIGSKFITGWGTKYKYPIGWAFDDEKTYIETIVTILDKNYPYGESNIQELVGGFLKDDPDHDYGRISYHETYGDFFDNVSNPFESKALALKSLLFIVDYQAFYNGTVIHSKDIVDSPDIISNDNASSSLSLLEKDGLSQKEKVNRLGNKTIQISARYDNIEDMQELGDVYNNDDDTDVIIYHREYSIYDNMINVIYFGAKDYVLKNYYTSVFARHRTWNLMSYGESVRRSENRLGYLVLSKDKSLYEAPQSWINNDNITSLLLSSFYPSTISGAGKWEKNDKIDYGYIAHGNNYYLTDINAFSCGYSLCLNISMVDNISMGVFIEKASPFSELTQFPGENTDEFLNIDFKDLTPKWFDIHKDYSGSLQNWYSVIDDDETGFTEELGFFVAHRNKRTTELYDDKFVDWSKTQQLYFDYLFALPKISKVDNVTNKIGNYETIYKDNKEIIDMTYQFEPVAYDDSVLFSSWFMKLNDLLSNYKKVDFDKIAKTEIPSDFIPNKEAMKFRTQLLCKTDDVNVGRPRFLIEINNNNSENIPAKMQTIIENGMDLAVDFSQTEEYYLYQEGTNSLVSSGTLIFYKFYPKQILSIDTNTMTVLGRQIVKIQPNTGPIDFDDVYSISEDDVELIFEKIKLYPNGGNEYISDYERVFYMGNIVSITAKNFYDGVERNFVYSEEYGKNQIGLTIENTNFISNAPNVTIEIPSMWNDFTGTMSWGKFISLLKRTMYIVTSETHLKNTLVYDEYTETTLPYSIQDISFNTAISVNDDINRGKYVQIDISKLKPIGEWKLLSSKLSTNIGDAGLYAVKFKSNNSEFIGIEIKENDNSTKSLYFIDKLGEKQLVYIRGVLVPELSDIDIKAVSYSSDGDRLYTWLQNNAEKKDDAKSIKSIQYWFKEYQTENLHYIISTSSIPSGNHELKALFKTEDNSLWEKIRTSRENGLKIEFYNREIGWVLVFNKTKWLKPFCKNIVDVSMNYDDYTDSMGVDSDAIEYQIFLEWLNNCAIKVNDNHSMKFVFGVNLTDEDIERGYVKIYASLISNRDVNVYDENNNVIGKVRNYIKNSEDSYGTDQYYDDIIE